MTRSDKRYLALLALFLLAACVYIDFRARLQEARMERALRRMTREVDASAERAIWEMHRAAWNTPPPIRVPGETE